jgi:hypothetical protein
MHFKLILSQADKAICLQYSLRIVGGRRHFLFEVIGRILPCLRHSINDQLSELTTVCKGLSKLVVVDIALNHDQDNPQLIF